MRGTSGTSGEVSEGTLRCPALLPGGGGAPESLRLMANQLSGHGLSFDLFDRGRFRPNIERLAQLPTMDEAAEPFSEERVGEYGAIVIAGPWQDPRIVGRVLRQRRPSQRLLYMPRGGLTKIEFSRPRDIKKWPYLYLVERRLVSQCETLVFSSEFERNNTMLPRRLLERSVVIPDLFAAPPAPAAVPPPNGGPVTFGFMAEITPLKGLAAAGRGVRGAEPGAWLARPDQAGRGGGLRRGREAYFRKVLAFQAAHADSADITFVGPVSHARRAEFYGAADIFVAPSRSRILRADGPGEPRRRLCHGGRAARRRARAIVAARAPGDHGLRQPGRHQGRALGAVGARSRARRTAAARKRWRMRRRRSTRSTPGPKPVGWTY